MEIRQLRYFVTVAEHLNFTEASKRLYVAQPAISKQIANLEKELGIQLFHRDHHRVQLTKAGAVFFEEVKEILARLDRAIETARDADKGLVGQLEIGFLRSPVRFFMPALIKDFQSAYPDVKVELHPNQTGVILQKLQADELDIGLTISPGLKDDNDFEVHPLLSYPLCVIMNSDHPLSRKESIDFGELRDENFIMLERVEAPHTYDYVISLCEGHGFTPKIVKQTARIESVLLLIESGSGITVLPKYLVEYATPSLQFKDIKGDYQVEFVVAWKKTNTNPAIPLFIERLYKHVLPRQ